jgi:hypothetical protein
MVAQRSAPHANTRSFIFNNFRIPRFQPSICNSPSFITLQIPLPATPFFCHVYKTPGCHSRRSRISCRSTLFITNRLLSPTSEFPSRNCFLFATICVAGVGLSVRPPKPLPAPVFSTTRAFSIPVRSLSQIRGRSIVFNQLAQSFAKYRRRPLLMKLFTSHQHYSVRVARSSEQSAYV